MLVKKKRNKPGNPGCLALWGLFFLNVFFIVFQYVAFQKESLGSRGQSSWRPFSFFQENLLGVPLF